MLTCVFVSNTWFVLGVFLCVVSMLVSSCLYRCGFLWCFFFQAEDGIRDLVRSRGLGDVYKRQSNARD